MKESYVKGSSDPSRPRVMAVCPQGHIVSVDSPSTSLRTFRAVRRGAIELRNHPFRTPTSCNGREGNTMRGAIASRDIGPAESKTLCMRGNSMPENREIPAVSSGWLRRPSAGRSGKVCGPFLKKS